MRPSALVIFRFRLVKPQEGFAAHRAGVPGHGGSGVEQGGDVPVEVTHLHACESRSRPGWSEDGAAGGPEIQTRVLIVIARVKVGGRRFRRA